MNHQNYSKKHIPKSRQSPIIINSKCTKGCIRKIKFWIQKIVKDCDYSSPEIMKVKFHPFASQKNTLNQFLCYARIGQNQNFNNFQDFFRFGSLYLSFSTYQLQVLLQQGRLNEKKNNSMKKLCFQCLKRAQNKALLSFFFKYLREVHL